MLLYLVVTAASSDLRSRNVELRFATSHPREPQLVLGIQVRPIHAVKIEPSCIRLGAAGAQVLSRRRPISIVVSGDMVQQGHKIKAVTTEEGLALREASAACRDERRFTMAVTESIPGGVVRGDVVFHLLLNGRRGVASISVTGVVLSHGNGF
jgi:hypothetical protein